MKYALITILFAALFFPSCKKDAQTIKDNTPTITLRTLPPSIIGNYYASVGIEILDDGGEDIISTGLCWSLKTDPTVNDSNFITGKTTGTFNVNIKNLVPENRYYARAFATNRFGTVYGNRISFITSLFYPAFANVLVSGITQTTAQVVARISDNGGAPVTERGLIWDTIQNPTILTSPHIALGTDTGTYTYQLTGLTPLSRYSVVAYAINKKGTGYSTTTFLSTLAPLPPTVTTTPLVVDNTGAVVTGGTVTASSGVVVGERGIIFTTNKEPGVTNKVVSGSGPGTFTATFTRRYTGSGSGYSVHAYAEYTYKNITNTVYGDLQQIVNP